MKTIVKEKMIENILDLPSLSKARKSIKMTQKKLAEKANVDKRIIRQIEHGEPLPSITICEKILDALDTDCDIGNDRRNKLWEDIAEHFANYLDEEINLTEQIYTIDLMEETLQSLKKDLIKELELMI